MKADVLRILSSGLHGMFAQQVSASGAFDCFAFCVKPIIWCSTFFGMKNTHHGDRRVKRVGLNIMDVEMEGFRDPKAATVKQDRNKDVSKVQSINNLWTLLTTRDNKTFEEKIADLVLGKEFNICPGSFGRALELDAAGMS